MIEILVLTGDIVKSSTLSKTDLDLTLQSLEQATKTLETQIKVTSPDIRGAFSRRAGDAWQMAINKPEIALRAAIYMFAATRRLDKARTTRIAIGIGPGEIPSDDNTNAGYGKAFTASGRLLETMPKGQRIAFAKPGLIAANLTLASAICENWTAIQADTIKLTLDNPNDTHEELGAKISKKSPTIRRALNGGEFPFLKNAILDFEAEFVDA